MSVTQEELIAALEHCYRSSGVDTTHMPTDIAKEAMRAVDDLRRDYDEACEELAGFYGPLADATL